MLNVDKSVALDDNKLTGIALVDNKLQTLQLQSVLQTMNVRLRLTFLNTRLALIQRMFQRLNARSAFY